MKCTSSGSSTYWICEEKEAHSASDSLWTYGEAVAKEGSGRSFIIFVSPSKKQRAGRLLHKLCVGGISVALLVRPGRGDGARSMPVGVTVCSNCLSPVISGRG